MPSRIRLLPVAVIGLVLAIFALAIVLVSAQLRQSIREQIVSRDGTVLQALSVMQQYAAEASDTLGSLIEDPMDQLSIILETSRLKDVLAVRLFDSHGRFITAFPPDVREAQMEAKDLARLQGLQPVSHFIAKADLSDYIQLPSEPEGHKTAPLLEAFIPIQPKKQPRLVGIAQFILDGRGVADEFGNVDGYLFRHGVLVFIAGSAVIVLALGWAFRRLDRMNCLLSERTASLLRANQELSLSAKISAIGAVTAHLIHGLKNPLSGLQSFMANCNSLPGNDSAVDWKEATATAQRMRTIIDEVARVLRDEQGATGYEVTWAELAELLEARVTLAARQAGIQLDVIRSVDDRLTNREANLILLVLENLVRNALQATPKGKAVQLNLFRNEHGIACEVCDQGPGFPDSLRSSLFAPCRSSKEGGIGIGLAISKQLAHHLGATLELKSSSPQGCVFALVIPQKR
ncbi:MAG: ATP-binding protein [Candidatus Omnitrophica bacterium]|nr:ATP-binding protein [Candidatus Omnitrophota bacterium]